MCSRYTMLIPIHLIGVTECVTMNDGEGNECECDAIDLNSNKYVLEGLIDNEVCHTDGTQ